MDKLETLKHYFGHDAFRPGQEEMVDALLAGRDAVGVMPTGAGKSMCYQIPALMGQGVALVVSPLISLMKDQVAALKSAGVPAAYLNSSLTARQMDIATERARQGMYRIIYVAPERLEVPSFLSFARQTKLSLLAVDEAHCVSQWGQDFRPNYLKIADFVDALPQRPVVGAFTATATQRVRDDIIRLLRLQNPVIASTGFDRPNLYFEVVRPKNKYAALSAILRTMSDRSGIVYCATRKNVEEVCDKLTQDGLSVARYHAGLADEERQRSQEDFQYDRVQVMVATNAFGMGIDKSNVSFVIHYNMPRSMEAYYQEAGRAGRDGEDAACILLYSGSDIYTAKWMIEHGEPNAELTENEQRSVRNQDLARLQTMIHYCTDDVCLRQYILRYFGERAPDRCEGCSHCEPARYGFTEELARPSRKRVYADGTGKPAAVPAVYAEPPRPKPPASQPADPDNLFELLRACRMQMAQAMRLPPYIVCDDKTLDDMVRRHPSSLNDMLAVRGMGIAKVGKYGDKFLQVIRAYDVTHPRPGKAAGRTVVVAVPRAQGSTHRAAASASPHMEDAHPAESKAPRLWSPQEDEQLQAAYLQGTSIADIAREHERTTGAIRARLKKQGLIL